MSALTLAVLVSTASAAEDASDLSVATSDRVATGVDVRTIIASVSQRTHRKFVVDPRVVAAVNLDGITVGEVTYPLLLTILAVHGFAVYEQEGIVVIAPDANERFFPSNLVKPDDIRAPDAQIVTTIVAVKNMRAPELVTVIRPLMAPNSQVNALADRNALIIVDKAANVRRMVTIIRELDTMPVFKAE
ncbi:MAG TPA: secretin N-terminal domain-containing protein [Steroidobacteraceae bacterium]|nr:secretin N-terminal domain-containing protein [Steroidobacteraceae bacterium]